MENLRHKSEKYFSYLLKNGFHVDQIDRFGDFYNKIVNFKSNNMVVTIGHDRGEISVILTPKWQYKKKGYRDIFGLEGIISYIKKDISYVIFYQPPEDIDAQLQLMAKELSKYLDDICAIFDKNIYQNSRNEIKKFMNKRSQYFDEVANS